MKNMIDPTAIIDNDVVLGDGVRVGAYVRIENGVRLGNNISIGPYVHIKGNTEIADNTKLATGAVIGEIPQLAGKNPTPGALRIGKNNVIREYVTIHGASSPDTVTAIGDNNYFMACSHVAHDCMIGNNVVVCNGALIAGHVELQDKVFISGNVVIHQFVKIGRLAFIAGLARVNQDVPPFMMVIGDSRIWGLNLVGLQRDSLSKDDIEQIKKGYRVLYRKNFSVKKALAELNHLNTPWAKELIDFVRASKRGVCRQKRSSLWERIFLDYPYFARTKIIDNRCLNRFIT